MRLDKLFTAFLLVVLVALLYNWFNMPPDLAKPGNDMLTLIRNSFLGL